MAGAIDGLIRHGVKHEDIEISWVPGAFEIPLIAQKMATLKRYDAAVTGIEMANLLKLL